ncbi:hypothetical protein DFH09DRAFT_1226285 [Mycena vulgaris]|nr:hypothetical protein DFH09DRAFT_1226285 [Mycena vulgaris]
MASDIPSPPLTFPAELEREIFEIAARSRPLSIPTLMLVAWRVKLWFVLTASPGLTNHLIQLIHSRPALLRESVQHLYLYWIPKDDAQVILSACPVVENLWIGGGMQLEDLIRTIEDLPLKHLYCHMDSIFGSHSKIDFKHRIFTHITHLKIFDFSFPGGIDLGMWGGLALVPHLTHLCFDDETFLPFLDRPMLVGDKPALLKDHRFIFMSCERYAQDWHTGARTGLDFWSRAEDFIARRRSGEIDPLQCVITEETRVTISPSNG